MQRVDDRERMVTESSIMPSLPSSSRKTGRVSDYSVIIQDINRGQLCVRLTGIENFTTINWLKNIGSLARKLRTANNNVFFHKWLPYRDCWQTSSCRLGSPSFCNVAPPHRRVFGLRLSQTATSSHLQGSKYPRRILHGYLYPWRWAEVHKKLVSVRTSTATWHCRVRVSSCNIYAVQQDTQCGLNE